MTPKRGLITDTFKIVKKTSRGGKRDKSPSPPIAGGTECLFLFVYVHISVKAEICNMSSNYLEEHTNAPVMQQHL